MPFLMIPWTFWRERHFSTMPSCLYADPGTRIYRRFKDQDQSYLTIGATMTTIPSYFNPRTLLPRSLPKDTIMSKASFTLSPQSLTFSNALKSFAYQPPADPPFTVT